MSQNTRNIDEALVIETRAELLRMVSLDIDCRHGDSDRLEIGRSESRDTVDGYETLRVGGSLTEETRARTISAQRLSTAVTGKMHVGGMSDTTLVGGAVSEMCHGPVMVVAGMSDDLVGGLGMRLSTPLDIWLAALMGVDEHVGTAIADLALVEASITHFEREYGPSAHAAAAAVFFGQVYTTMATGFRPLIRALKGIRDLSPGGGGGGAAGAAGGGAAAGATVGGGAMLAGGVAGGAVRNAAGGSTIDNIADAARVADSLSDVGGALDEMADIGDLSSLAARLDVDNLAQDDLARASDTAAVLEDVRTGSDNSAAFRVAAGSDNPAVSRMSFQDLDSAARADNGLNTFNFNARPDYANWNPLPVVPDAADATEELTQARYVTLAETNDMLARMRARVGLPDDDSIEKLYSFVRRMETDKIDGPREFSRAVGVASENIDNALEPFRDLIGETRLADGQDYWAVRQLLVDDVEDARTAGDLVRIAETETALMGYDTVILRYTQDVLDRFPEVVEGQEFLNSLTYAPITTTPTVTQYMRRPLAQGFDVADAAGQLEDLQAEWLDDVVSDLFVAEDAVDEGIMLRNEGLRARADLAGLALDELARGNDPMPALQARLEQARLRKSAGAALFAGEFDALDDAVDLIGMIVNDIAARITPAQDASSALPPLPIYNPLRMMQEAADKLSEGEIGTLVMRFQDQIDADLFSGQTQAHGILVAAEDDLRQAAVTHRATLERGLSLEEFDLIDFDDFASVRRGLETLAAASTGDEALLMRQALQDFDRHIRATIETALHAADDARGFAGAWSISNRQALEQALSTEALRFETLAASERSGGVVDLATARYWQEVAHRYRHAAQAVHQGEDPAQALDAQIEALSSQLDDLVEPSTHGRSTLFRPTSMQRQMLEAQIARLRELRRDIANMAYQYISPAYVTARGDDLRNVLGNPPAYTTHDPWQPVRMTATLTDNFRADIADSLRFIDGEGVAATADDLLHADDLTHARARLHGPDGQLPTYSPPTRPLDDTPAPSYTAMPSSDETILQPGSRWVTIDTSPRAWVYPSPRVPLPNGIDQAELRTTLRAVEDSLTTFRNRQGVVRFGTYADNVAAVRADAFRLVFISLDEGQDPIAALDEYITGVKLSAAPDADIKAYEDVRQAVSEAMSDQIAKNLAQSQGAETAADGTQAGTASAADGWVPSGDNLPVATPMATERSYMRSVDSLAEAVSADVVPRLDAIESPASSGSLPGAAEAVRNRDLRHVLEAHAGPHFSTGSSVRYTVGADGQPSISFLETQRPAQVGNDGFRPLPPRPDATDPAYETVGNLPAWLASRRLAIHDRSYKLWIMSIQIIRGVAKIVVSAQKVAAAIEDKEALLALHLDQSNVNNILDGRVDLRVFDANGNVVPLARVRLEAQARRDFNACDNKTAALAKLADDHADATNSAYGFRPVRAMAGQSCLLDPHNNDQWLYFAMLLPFQVAPPRVQLMS